MDQTTPILLVPGLASSARIYAPVVPALWRFGPVMVANHIRDDSMVRFVGCRRLETTEESQILHLCRKAQFFEEFPDQRRLWRLLLLHLATGLHEGNSAALAHKQCLPVRAQHQSRRYAYRFCHDLIGFADEFHRS